MIPKDHLFTPREFRHLVDPFLGHILILKSRWGGDYKPLTELLIKKAAVLQWYVLLETF